MNLTREFLTIPNPDPSSAQFELSFPMDRVYDAESKYDTRITPLNANDLVRQYSLALKDLGEHLAKLTRQSAKADSELRKRRAVLFLDVVPAKLGEKKLSSNDSNRESVVDSDPQYNVLVEIRDDIQAALTLIKNKYSEVSKAKYDVTVMYENMKYVSANPDLVSALYGQTKGEVTNLQTGTSTLQIGKPLYVNND